MFRFAPYVLKSLWRHRTRTLLTVSGSAAALLVFAFVQSARMGLENMTRGARAERTLIIYQANRFCPSSSRLPEDYTSTIKKVPGVSDVVPIQVFVNNCRASLDSVLFHGLPSDKLSKARNINCSASAREAFEAHDDAALVGETLARRRSLSPGDRFTIGSISVTIAGVFTAPTTAEENILYAHLSYLQLGMKALNVVTQFEVHLTEDADPEAVSREIDGQFKSDRVATDTRTLGAFQATVIADLAEMIRWSHLLGYACVILVLMLVATTTVMAVQDRAVEHAVLQAIGFSGPRIFGLVLSEGVLLTLVGGLLGIGAAMVWLSLFPVVISTEAVQLVMTASPGMALEGAVVSLIVGVIAGAIPAWQAARADIVPALRQG